MSVFQVQGARRIFVGERFSLASEESRVVDMRGMAGVTAWFETGVATVTATPVDDAEGTPIPFAEAANLTSGQLLNTTARFFEITASSGPAVVHLIS